MRKNNEEFLKFYMSIAHAIIYKELKIRLDHIPLKPELTDKPQIKIESPSQAPMILGQSHAGITN